MFLLNRLDSELHEARAKMHQEEPPPAARQRSLPGRPRKPTHSTLPLPGKARAGQGRGAEAGSAEKSPLWPLLGVQVARSVTCGRCKLVSSRLSSSLGILSLQIPSNGRRSSASSRRGAGGGGRAGRGPLSLEDLLQHAFADEERLQGDDSFFCTRCQSKVKEAYRRSRIQRLGNTVIFHLCRTRFDPRSFRSYKDQTSVCLPLASRLDLTPFLCGPAATDSTTPACSRSNSGGPHRRHSLKQRANTPSPTFHPSSPPTAPSALFELFACVSHHGRSMDSGHYTALVQDPPCPPARSADLAGSPASEKLSGNHGTRPKYYRYNDDRVHCEDTLGATLTDKESYLLFFRRCQPVNC